MKAEYARLQSIFAKLDNEMKKEQSEEKAKRLKESKESKKKK